MLDPPFQDVERLKTDAKLRVATTTDLGTQYLTFDQARDELLHSDVKGRNPFKDKRVRQAAAHAINIDLIMQKVLRGQATATGAFISPRVDGHLPELDRRLPFDPTEARALLAETGYPNGFGVTLDCVNVAWREGMCQAATAMLTQVGIRTTRRSSTTNPFFPKLSQATASFIEYGWAPTTDARSTAARRTDRRGAHRARPGQAPRPRRHGAAPDPERPALYLALPPQAELGDGPQRAAGAVAERCGGAALGAHGLKQRALASPPCSVRPWPGSRDEARNCTALRGLARGGGVPNSGPSSTITFIKI